MPLVLIVGAGLGELGTAAAAAELATTAAGAAELGTAAAAGAELGGVAAAAAPEVLGGAVAPLAEGITGTLPGAVEETAAMLPEQISAAQNGIAETLGTQGGANPALTQAGPAPTVPQGIDASLNVQGGIDQTLTNAANPVTAPTGTPSGPPLQDVTTPEYAKDMRDIYGPTPGSTNVQGEAIDAAAKYSGSYAPETASSGLQKGIESAMKFTKDYPLVTSLGIQAAGRLLGPSGDGGPPKENYKKKDMRGYNTSSPSTIEYNSKFGSTPYANGGLTYGIGGQVEQMSAQNALGANQMYPQSQLQTPMYSNPMVQRPVQSNVINSGIDTPVDPYTGEMKYAKGGTTSSEPNYSQMLGAVTPEQQKANEEYLQAYAKREMAGSINTDSDVDTAKKDPLHASMTRLQKIGKRVGVKTADLPKSGIVDSNVFHAAEGGSVPNSDHQYYNPNNSALRAEESQNATMPDMGIYGFLTQMFGGGAKGPGAAVFPTLQGFGNMGSDPTKQPIHYTGMAQGGITHGLGGYSDGGRLLKGPGDGVSDSIPATIGNKQPARLADGEFVVPARIVSELGNGSTDAGARKLYAMMERIQADRKKSIGKDKVAVNSKAAKHLPK